jgi:hypothetical protein
MKIYSLEIEEKKNEKVPDEPQLIKGHGKDSLGKFTLDGEVVGGKFIMRKEYTENRVKCKKGHECEWFDGSHPTYRAGYACCEAPRDGGCGKDARKGWHCKHCQYDLCADCGDCGKPDFFYCTGKYSPGNLHGYIINKEQILKTISSDFKFFHPELNFLA